MSGGGRPRHRRLRGGHLQGRLSHVLQALHAITADEGSRSEAKRCKFIIYKVLNDPNEIRKPLGLIDSFD